MSHQPRRILTSGASRKRKEVEGFYANKPCSPPAPAPAPASPTAATLKAAEPASSNRLLAGYMAYEFLTKGTLFGQKLDPARAEAVPLPSSAAEGKRMKPSLIEEAAEPSKQPQSYGELATLLKTDGAHIPGIVNPTQLARWIQMRHAPQ